MTYNVNVLKTPDACRRVMSRAKLADPDLYLRVMQRHCELEEANHQDPVVRAFWGSMVVSEQLMSEKTNRNWRSTRVRNRLKELGNGIEAVIYLFEKWATLQSIKPGFENLIDAGFPQYTAEYIVAYRFPERFSDNAVAVAKIKLAKYGIKATIVT
jgi:hypothetical protein